LGKDKKSNLIFHHGGGEIGVITSGVSFEYAKEISGELGINPPIAKISLTNPLSEKFIINFIITKKAVTWRFFYCLLPQ